MRTTLDIDEDVLLAAKEIARRRNLSAGQVVSQLLRGTLTGQLAHAATPGSGEHGSEPQSVGGFRPFPSGKAIVTNDTVNRLRDTEGI